MHPTMRTRSVGMRVAVGAAAAGLVAVGLLSVAVHRALTARPATTLDNAIYVWRRIWDDDLRAAVHKADRRADGFWVLAAEVTAKDDAVQWTKIPATWPALAGSAARVTLVMRADVSVMGILRSDGVAAADVFRQHLLELGREADAAGVNVRGFQLDLDCPTSKLATYADLLQTLRPGLESLDLSITTLPDWLRSPAFPKVVQGLACFVVQVHSIEKPSVIDAPVTLCRTERVAEVARKASGAGVPFYIALPTYGYEVAFDADGQFVGLAAEGPAPAWAPGVRTRVVMSDPMRLARVVSTLDRNRPAGLKGLAWFRLPVSSDRLNWSWATLEAVMQGREPLVCFAAEVRRPNPDLHEVWVRNAGEYVPRGKTTPSVALDVRIPARAVRASDLLNGFSETSGRGGRAMRLAGPAPLTDEPIMVAWFRLAPAQAEDAGPVQAGPVEVLP